MQEGGQGLCDLPDNRKQGYSVLCMALKRQIGDLLSVAIESRMHNAFSLPLVQRPASKICPEPFASVRCRLSLSEKVAADARDAAGALQSFLTAA